MVSKPTLPKEPLPRLDDPGSLSVKEAPAQSVEVEVVEDRPVDPLTGREGYYITTKNANGVVSRLRMFSGFKR